MNVLRLLDWQRNL